MSTERIAKLIAQIHTHCDGTIVWRAMNEDETGYSMEFDWKPDAHRWFAENPNASRGRHLVEVRVFTKAEELANEAAQMLAALHAKSEGPPMPDGAEATRQDRTKATKLRPVR